MTPYEELAVAIVAQAAKEYRRALKALKKDPGNQEAKDSIMELEAFFHSPRYQELTSVDAEYLIERIRKEVMQ